MNHLITLQLVSCRKIECVIDNTMNVNNSVFSKLCNLKVLSIFGCPMLTSLFVPSVVQSLVLLEELKIIDCNALRHIIEEVEGGNNVLTSTPSHSYLTLQKLKILSIQNCNNLEYILSENLVVGLVSLESVAILYCFELKHVFGSDKERNHAIYPSEKETNIINFSNLHTLRLLDLPIVIDIWPQYCRRHLPNLKKLYCHKCPKLLDFSISKVMTVSNLPQETTSKVIYYFKIMISLTNLTT